MIASDTKSLYIFKEFLGLYDLNVQVAALVAGKPRMVFLQGTTDLTSTCVVTEGKGPNLENFYVCDCKIRAKTGSKVCSLIIDSPTAVKYAYQL